MIRILVIEPMTQPAHRLTPRCSEYEALEMLMYIPDIFSK